MVSHCVLCGKDPTLPLYKESNQRQYVNNVFFFSNIRHLNLSDISQDLTQKLRFANPWFKQLLEEILMSMCI